MRHDDRRFMAQLSGVAEYDYVVVGGGTAGCVVAARLAAAGEATVLLIEAGPDGRGVAQIPDPALWAKLRKTSLDWGYDCAPSAHVAGRAIPLPRGRVLGGCSATGAMQWSRGHPADYDAWERAGAAGWNYQTMLPYFQRAEDWEGGASPLRGAGGPMRVERPRNPHPVAAAMLDAAAELGLPVLDDVNGPDNCGAALANLSVTAGRRHSVVDGYLAGHRSGVADDGEQPNLTVLTGSLAVRLCFTGNRCESVTHTVRGAPRVTRARREVIVALGAIGTPLLLVRSGIGDPADLARLGVPARAALPGVGANLRDHPLLAGMNFRARRRLGLVRDNGGGAVLNWCSPGAPRPDLHAFVVQGRHADATAAASYGLNGGGDIFAISPALLGPRSSGRLRVRALSDDGERDIVEIQPNFLADPSDTQALAESMEMILDLAGTRAYRALIDAPVMPRGRLAAADRARFVRKHCAAAGHPCGTAAIGTGPDAVVDPALRVIGIEGLRVADASVIPVIPGCDLQAPVVALAERAADLITGGRP
jgi:choline dehydrogenase